MPRKTKSETTTAKLTHTKTVKEKKATTSTNKTAANKTSKAKSKPTKPTELNITQTQNIQKSFWSIQDLETLDSHTYMKHWIFPF